VLAQIWKAQSKLKAGEDLLGLKYILQQVPIWCRICA